VSQSDAAHHPSRNHRFSRQPQRWLSGAIKVARFFVAIDTMPCQYRNPFTGQIYRFNSNSFPRGW
jgi:hypothetical protein